MATNLEGAPLQQDNFLEETAAVEAVLFFWLLIAEKRDGTGVEQTDLGFFGFVVWADNIKGDKTTTNTSVLKYFNEEVFIFKKSFK